MRDQDEGAGKGAGGAAAPGSAARYAGLGIQLAVTLLVFLWIGQWLDRRLGGGGLITVACVLVGFGGTMYSLIRRLSRGDGK